MLTWRDMYLEEIERQADTLRTAKQRGQTWMVFNGRTYDPTCMSDEKARQLALREAERITNYAINVELEQARIKGRPADVN